MAILSSIGRVYIVSVQKKGLGECQKKRLSFHFSSERIKLQSFALTINKNLRKLHWNQE